jgi:hypothetical protein
MGWKKVELTLVQLESWPYKTAVIHSLLSPDCEARICSCRWFQESVFNGLPGKWAYVLSWNDKFLTLWDWLSPFFNKMTDKKNCMGILPPIVNNSTEVSDEVFRELVTSWELWSLPSSIINPCDLFLGHAERKEWILKMHTLWQNFKKIWGIKLPLFPYSSFSGWIRTYSHDMRYT